MPLAPQEVVAKLLVAEAQCHFPDRLLWRLITAASSSRTGTTFAIPQADVFYRKLTILSVFDSAMNMGGAILAAQVSVVKVCGLVKDNNANGHGGAIASIGQALLFFCQGAALRSNSAGGNGGCVYAAGAGTSFGELKDIMRRSLQAHK
jgi:hypothetical protein